MVKRFLVGWFVVLWGSLASAGVPCSLPFNLQNNTTADATQVMANYNAIVTCLGNAAASGANSDITGLFGLTSPLGPTFGGANTFYGGTSSGLNNYTVTVVPNTFSLTIGFMVSMTIGTTNTAASTLTVNGGSTINVFRATPTGPVAMTGGELAAGNRALFGYDGTQWQLLAQTAQVGGYGPLTNLASAATTDLGTISSHNVQITGTATITSFGASAITTYPVYKIEFFSSGAVLTNSGSLALLGSANITVQAGDTAEMIYAGSGSWSMLSYQRFNGNPLTTNPTVTVQRFTSGTSLTYTPTAGTIRIHVRIAGGGGGGGAQITNNGSNGADTAFGSWTAIHGAGGVAGTSSSAGGAGGTGGVNGTGILVVRLAGGSGQGGAVQNALATTAIEGGSGGNNAFGGAGGGAGGSTASSSAAANTGAGGGGAGGDGNANSAAGGGAGEYVEFWVTSPTATVYTVGTGGAGGAAGSRTGGNGGAGIIVIEEFYT